MRVGIDIGGTFTDLAGYEPGVGFVIGKALNSGTGPTEGTNLALRSAGIEAGDVAELTHGTTVVTNLLIERTGAPVGLICTRGFRDVLEIGFSQREQTFAARYRKPEPLVPRNRRLEIGGRIEPSGVEEEPVDPDEVRAVVAELRERGAETIAVALFNAYANPAHEKLVAEICEQQAPGVPVTCATDVDAKIGEYERASTAVLNATAVPAIAAYVGEIGGVLSCPTLYMNSAGGVLPPAEALARPIQLALSGPAAGVIAAREVMSDLGLDMAITLDMGGTSADVCLVDRGEVRESESLEIEWGVPARGRSTDIRTIGAGGGSLARRDAGGALTVGPASAGAIPGPACYGRGGEEPTVTDANLLLGILSPDGLVGGEVALETGLAERAVHRLARRLEVDDVEMAKGIHRVVNARMAQAIREITVHHGIDPRSCALIAFGGAGPQHAYGVADELDVTRLVVPANGSVLSATGLLSSDVRISVGQTVLLPVEELEGPAAAEVWARLSEEISARLGSTAMSSSTLQRWAGLRYRNQWHEVALALNGNLEDLRARFEAEHEKRFGTRLDSPVEALDVWLTLIGHRDEIRREEGARIDTVSAASSSRRAGLFDRDVAVVRRHAIGPSPRRGPLLIDEQDTVTVVPPGWTVRSCAGHLDMTIGEGGNVGPD